MENNKNLPIVKSVNEELRQATFVVLAPDEVDLHSDTITEEEIRKACHSYNLFCRKANLFHMTNTNTFDVVESYIAPTDMVIDDREIKKGTWLVVTQVNSDDLWALVKSGEICSVSISAMGIREEIKE